MKDRKYIAKINGEKFSVCKCKFLRDFSSWTELWAKAIIKRQKRNECLFNEQYNLVLDVRAHYLSSENKGESISVGNFYRVTNMSYSYAIGRLFNTLDDLKQACGFPCAQYSCAER